jgi:hypothetical protein
VALWGIVFTAFPVAAGIAILRHRLYDIDVVINRALVYGALTLLLGAAYAAIVLLVGVALGGGSAPATGVATLAVALAFRPLKATLFDPAFAAAAGLPVLVKGVLTPEDARLAVEHGAAGLRANVVAPGWVRTEMADEEMDEFGGPRGLDREAAYAEITRHVPARRPATSDEAAAAVVWLLSPEAAYVNGAVLTVDGGTSVVDPGTLAFGG